ncbi:TetR/AcrR family transcriptional regulator [Microvirga roseola]|uniref:TetR/AcrR family transcriptional regulator n=1 Tax=Microvirga roseola TaxID=2883126 RepID=UPI001E3708BB|nr:TetR/AcrR family transcriptional regulator [Microvirga roseola]
MPTKQKYHHGNLREELLEAGSLLLRQGGAQVVDLRSVAGQIGVSQTAIYRHFRNKEALIAAILERAFITLTEALNQALSKNRDRDDYDALIAAYIDFARGNPWLVRTMFNGLMVDRSLHPDLCVASRGLLELLAAQATRYTSEANAHSGAALSWSIMHGLATLIIENQMPSLINSPELISQMVRAAAASVRSGLAALASMEG